MKHVISSFVMLAVVISVFCFPYTAASPTPTLVIGSLAPLPTTFFQGQNAWADYSQIPYLYPYTMGLGAFGIPGICNVPVPVPGTNDASWILNLRSTNYKWSDGAPMNSTDLAYSFGVYLYTGTYANRSTFDRWGHARGYISNIQILNSTAIQLNSFQPYPTFIVAMWFYAIYPYHYYNQFTGTNVLQTKAIIGGPADSAYIPNNYVPGGNTMNLVANPSSPSWNGATPPLDSVTIQFFTGDAAMVSALSAGTIDGAVILPSDVRALSSVPTVTVSQVPSVTFSTLYISPVGYPFNSATFRQGLMELIPRAQINQALYNGTSTPGNALRMIPPAMAQYWPGPSTPTYNYSIPNAQANFKAAGLTQNSAGAWVYPNGTKVTVNLQVSNNDPDLVRVGQFMQSALTSAGLSVNLQLLDPATVITDLFSGNYQTLIVGGGNGSVFPSPFRWMANNSNYPITWKNATFTSALRRALTEVDSAKALSYIKEAEFTLVQNAVVATILSVPQYVAYNSQKFAGWEPALSQAKQVIYFTNEFLSETLLTSVRPASSTTMTSSSTGVGGLSNATLIPAVVVVLVVAAIGVYLLKRRGQQARP